MPIRTASDAYVEYGFESTFKDGPERNKAFGIKESLSGYNSSNSATELHDIGDPEARYFSYGSHQGSASISFVLSNPWWLYALLGSVTSAGSGPVNHTYRKSNRIRTMDMEVGSELATGNMVRRLKGAVMSSASLSFRVDQTVDISTQVEWGDESNGSIKDATPADDDIGFPYYFVNAEIQIPTGTDQIEIQNIDLTINRNPSEYYGIGDKFSADAYASKLTYSGSFTKPLENADLLNDVIDRELKTGIVIKVSNGESGSSERSIEFQLSHVVFEKHDTAGMSESDKLEETINFKALSLVAIARNDTATPP